MKESGRKEIEAAIPHRDPFLFVERVLDDGDEHFETTWKVPADADWFRGHYPGTPVMPGVLISEHVFQSGALFVSARMQGFKAADGIPVLAKIESARFRRIVRPGETLRTTVGVRERLGPAWYMEGECTCEGETVLRIRFVLTATTAAAATG